MTFFQFIKSKVFLKNLLAATIVFLLIIVIILFLLKSYTRHGESFNVPSYIGFNLKEIKSMPNIGDFEIIISDSIYKSDAPKGTIICQEPMANTEVKRGRKIYLTTIAILPEVIKMPNLVDLTLRQARSIIESYGLLVGSVEYIPNIAQNAIIKQLHKGAEIIAGSNINKGEKIDLKVGINSSNYIQVPNLVGKSRNEALSIISRLNLILNDEIFLNSSDSTNAVVESQSPEYEEGITIEVSSTISLIYKKQ